jgi:hypothetical protein
MESHLVEFAGLPGSGKSVVSQALAAFLAASGTRVTTPSHELDHRLPTSRRLARKLSYAATGAIRRPDRAVGWIGAVARSRQFNLSALLSASTNWLYVAESIRRRNAEPGVHIFDQGLFQALWSLGYEAAALDAAWPELVARLTEALPPRLLVVIVEANVSLIRGRIEHRTDGASRLDRDLSLRTWDLSLERAQAVFDRVVTEATQLAATRRISLLQVRNDEATAPPAAAAAIAAVIASGRE